MIFTCPYHIRRQIWRYTMQIRNLPLKIELCTHRVATRRILDVLSNHHYMNALYIQKNAFRLYRIYEDLLGDKPSYYGIGRDLTEWLEICSRTSEQFSTHTKTQVRELLSAVLIQYTVIIKPPLLTCEQIITILDLYEKCEDCAIH